MSTPSLLHQLEQQLARLDTRTLRRQRRSVQGPCGARVTVGGKHLLAFCSNDYLGLASHPMLTTALAEGARQWGSGSGASHLLSGHYSVHDQLERELANFVDRDAALYFSSGYMANTGIIPALVGRGDAIFADRLNHASLVDGALLSRATLHRYPHNDLDRLEQQLAKSTATHKLIVTDAVFSMDGDIADLTGLFSLAERFDTWLIVDDAHGLGVLGPQGRGSLAEAGLDSWRIVQVGTLGKAAGLSGAFVAGHRTVVQWLMQKARTYIYTTATSPALAAALLKTLMLMREGENLRADLSALVVTLRDALRLQRWQLLPSRTAIQPVVIGDSEETMHVAQQLEAHGIWVPAIRPPTVPEGSARLRISLSAAHSHDEVLHLANVLNHLEEARA